MQDYQYDTDDIDNLIYSLLEDTEESLMSVNMLAALTDFTTEQVIQSLNRLNDQNLITLDVPIEPDSGPNFDGWLVSMNGYNHPGMRPD